jgi:hypothetical protein
MTHKPNKTAREEFYKKMRRIEKTMTGSIGGRKIWNVDPEDEDSYMYVDDSIYNWHISQLKKEKAKWKRKKVK